LSGRLAPEHTKAYIRQGQRPNLSTDPDGADYLALRNAGFTDYKLSVTGLVEAPVTLRYAQITALPSRTQITRHDCVEGWSRIAKWTGVPPGTVLTMAKPKANAY